MDLVQKVQAKLSQGKDAERFQRMEARAAKKDMTKQADPGTNLGGVDQLEKRQPEELVLNGIHYKTNYIMNHLGLKEDKRKKKEDDPMSAYDSSLLAGPTIKDKVHNHVRSKTKSASDETENGNSGEAGSLDYAARNIRSMKQHMKHMNIGKKLPGRLKKDAFEEVKDEIKVAYFLAGLMKTAGDRLPDFEKNPELFVSFLAGLTKDAGMRDWLGSAGQSTVQAISRFLGRATQADPEAGQILNPESTPWTQPLTAAGQRAHLQRQGPGQAQ